MDAVIVTELAWYRSGHLLMSELRVACIHGRYERHETSTWTETNPPRGKKLKLEPCPGGRLLTVGEVIEWIGEQDAGLLERLAET